MWYQIKQKQEKMAKARANINVYSSTPSSDFILEDEMRCSLYQELHGMWNEIGQASLFRAKERPIHATTELKHTERGTQHCNNGGPTPVCDPCRSNRKYSITHSSSMKGPSLKFHAERELEHPKITFFS